MILYFFELLALFNQFYLCEHAVACLHYAFGKFFFLYFFNLLLYKLATTECIFIDY